ncbi:hypothetical protein BJ742DRAFT_355779 [Cladochytrium replicatum]|nr:hypothetical protein BJ742DRAFT_355779 [Cladochytrium replicatum]
MSQSILSDNAPWKTPAKRAVTLPQSALSAPPVPPPRSASLITHEEPAHEEPKPDEQVGGHGGGIVFMGDGRLAKRSEPREMAFYENTERFRILRTKGALQPELAQFIDFVPHYYGSLAENLKAQHEQKLKKGEHSELPAEAHESDPEHPMILMEDLCFPFKKPCVADIKLGPKLYEDSATTYKKTYMTAYAAATTADQLGVLVSGYKVWDPSTKSYAKYPKKYGYSLTVNTWPLGLRTLFSDSRNKLVFRHTIPPLIARLKRLQNAVQHMQGHRMISSSILIIFDGAPVTESYHAKSDAEVPKPVDAEKTVDLRVIDFNHSYYEGTSKAGYTGIDENYLYGLETLIRTLEVVYRMPFDGPPATGKGFRFRRRTTEPKVEDPEVVAAAKRNEEAWAAWWADPAVVSIMHRKTEGKDVASQAAAAGSAAAVAAAGAVGTAIHVSGAVPAMQGAVESMRKWWKVDKERETADGAATEEGKH